MGSKVSIKEPNKKLKKMKYIAGVHLELDWCDMGFKGEVGPSSEERMQLKRS